MSDSEKHRHCGPGDAVGQTPTVIRRLGQREYLPILQAMRAFTKRRTPGTGDELWSLEHPPVFTQGLAGKPEHLLDAGDIPVVQTDRGGQITYHGPGQLVVYLLVDIRRAGIGPRALVNSIEAAIVSLLADLDIEGRARPEAPGVYVGDAKIASLGLRIRRGCSYHGLSLNVGMDLQPFQRINPCGYPGLPMIQIRDLHPNIDTGQIEDRLLHHLAAYLGYAAVRYDTSLPASSPTWDRDHGRA